MPGSMLSRRLEGGVPVVVRIQTRLRGRWRPDEAGYLSIEFALLITVVMLVFLLTLAYAIKAHSQRVAAASAEQGVAAAAAYNGSAGQGRATTTRFLHQMGGGLTGAQVTVSRSATQATVTVTAHAPAFLPLLPMTIHVQVSQPVERLVRPTQAGGGK